MVRLVDNNYDTMLDVSACQPGDKTRWITANMPEMHEEGYTKWQSKLIILLCKIAWAIFGKFSNCWKFLKWKSADEA